MLSDIGLIHLIRDNSIERPPMPTPMKTDLTDENIPTTNFNRISHSKSTPNFSTSDRESGKIFNELYRLPSPGTYRLGAYTRSISHSPIPTQRTSPNEMVSETPEMRQSPDFTTPQLVRLESPRGIGKRYSMKAQLVSPPTSPVMDDSSWVFHHNNHLNKRGYPSLSKENSKPQRYNTGTWSKEEHSQFLEGLRECGHSWTQIAERFVKTRERSQVASHAQKWLKKEMMTDD
jgi:SHAQKYF class myb-like DNA-binding protein